MLLTWKRTYLFLYVQLYIFWVSVRIHRCLVIFTGRLHAQSDGLVPREKSFHNSLVIEIKLQVKCQCFKTQTCSWKVNGNVSDHFSSPAIFTKTVSVCVLHVHWVKACCREGFVHTVLNCAVEQDVLGFVFSFLWSTEYNTPTKQYSWRHEYNLRHFSASAGSLLRHNLKLFSHTTKDYKKWGR